LNANMTGSGTAGGTTFQIAYVASARTMTITKSSGAGVIGDFQTILRGITYNNSSNTPNTTARTIAISANDGIVESSVATATIDITAANDAPTLNGDLSATEAEGGSYTLTTSDLSYIDPDDGDAEVTFTVSTLTNGAVKVGGSVATSFTGA